MTKGISNFLLYSDHNYLQSLKKLTGVRLPPEIQTMEEALFYHVSQVGDLNLPLDEDNLIVVYESINPVLAFVNSAVIGKLNTKMFNLLDSISTDPNMIMVLADTSFMPPNNLFAYSPSTKLRKHVTSNTDAAVFTMTSADYTLEKYNSKEDLEFIPECRQLISLKSFLIQL